jgi:hypothetical protein
VKLRSAIIDAPIAAGNVTSVCMTLRSGGINETKYMAQSRDPLRGGGWSVGMQSIAAQCTC